MTPTHIVAGADISHGRWAVVLLTNGRFTSALRVDRLAEIPARHPALAVLAVDIPIGLAGGGADFPRLADREARAHLSRAASAVFSAPPRPVLACRDYDAANALHRELTGQGLSRQSWALAAAIREADELAADDDRVIEVHPEVSFRAMAGEPLGASKKTWNGQHLRRRLLDAHGIVLPDRLEGDAGRLPPDDLLDAAAAAWTAHRFATGNSDGLGQATPDGRPNRHAGRIWL